MGTTAMPTGPHIPPLGLPEVPLLMLGISSGSLKRLTTTSAWAWGRAACNAIEGCSLKRQQLALELVGSFELARFVDFARPIPGPAQTSFQACGSPPFGP